MTHTKLKDDIFKELSQGPRSLSGVVIELSSKHSISPQAVYKMIRLLRKEEIVSVHSKQISLSLIWVSRQKELYSFVEKSYKDTAYIRDILLRESGRVIFRFRNLTELELFWTYVYLLIAENVDAIHPSYSIQPHDWYVFVREENQDYWEAKHKESNRLSRFVVTHTTQLDKIVLQERKKKQGKLLEFLLNHNPLKQEENIYYNVLGDFVFKVVFDKKVADKLNAFIAKTSKLPLSANSQKEINDILLEKGKFTIAVYKSEAKASALEAKIKKFFE